MSKPITIGLFGFGCVGQGLFKTLEQSKPQGVTLKKICVKNPEKERPLPREHFIFNPDDILTDEEINVVVELIDDSKAAFAILKKALEKGKHVVTANKKMLAENLDEVVRLQKKYNRSVLYEAAVCGSIPVIRMLEEYYAYEQITALEGIFNGSTNYVLTRVLDEQLTFAEALREAQRLGFAEADPSLDIEGLDPRNKLSITLLHAFGVMVRPEVIPVAGISHIGPEEAKFALSNHLAIKLVVQAYMQHNSLHAWVIPRFVPLTHPLAYTRYEFNAVHITGNYAGRQLLTGKGAGSLPTALAVLSDIAALQKDYRYPYFKFNGLVNSPEFSADAYVPAWVRFPEGNKVPWHLFQEVYSGYANAQSHFVTGRLALSNLAELVSSRQASVVLLPEGFKHVAAPAGIKENWQQVA